MTDPRSKPVPAAWRHEIDRWILHLAAAGHSPHTRVTRRDHLQRAARALRGSPWAVTGEQLAIWAGAQTWRRETRRSVYSSFKSFWRWGIAQGRTDASPAATLPKVRAERPRPNPAPELAIHTGIARSDGRTGLILRLAAETGMRRGEIAQVHRDDLVEDLTGWSIIAHGKGGRDRTLPLSDDLAAAVRKSCAEVGWCFPGRDHGHLSARWVGKLATMALPGRWTLHPLRHRFATTTHDESGDLLAVSELLGHASVGTTQRYVASRQERLRRVALTAALG